MTDRKLESAEALARRLRQVRADWFYVIDAKAGTTLLEAANALEQREADRLEVVRRVLEWARAHDNAYELLDADPAAVLRELTDGE